MSFSSLEVRHATVEDRLPLFRMLELYQYELSDIWGQEIDLHGEFGYDLDRYWKDPSCRPFVARCNGHYAGFALVDGATKIAGTGLWMAQFFVLKKYQRRGLGAAMALKIFSLLPGYWEVGQMANNLSAQGFWRKVISDHTQGVFAEHELTSGWWQGIVQCFYSGVEK